MTTEREKGQNSVQAKHHQLIPAEEMIRALQTGRDIGYNDLAAYIGSKINPYVSPSVVNALKYQTRLGRKDDERIELEKAIWYLMDAHNRISDTQKQPREFAPWAHMGKIKQCKDLGVDMNLFYPGIPNETFQGGDEWLDKGVSTTLKQTGS